MTLDDIEDLVAIHGSLKQASLAIGKSKNYLHERQKTLQLKKLKNFPSQETKLTFPKFTDPDIDVEELIEKQLIPQTKLRINAHNEKVWFPIEINTDKPIGIICFGDPHIDDNYCNWAKLKKDIDIAKSQDNLFCINIGDSHNNWVGRLMKLYAEQEMSRTTAYRLIDWFMFKAGLKWLAWIHGNHDSWENGGAIQQAMGGELISMHDWRAQFKLVFKNKREILFDVAHDHKGHSQWNPVHAQTKVAMTEKTPHIAIAGHRHNPAYSLLPNPWEGIRSHLIRVGSYKAVDHHALVNGYPNHQWGESCIIIIDPREDNKIHVEFDLELGVKLLNCL